MKKLQIKNINNYDYLLVDDLEKEYNLNLEFYGLENSPNIGDIIYLNKKLLLNNQMYCFGIFGSEYSKKISIEDEQEILVLETDKKKIYLQRYYG